jgi:hypothetical protein
MEVTRVTADSAVLHSHSSFNNKVSRSPPRDEGSDIDRFRLTSGSGSTDPRTGHQWLICMNIMMIHV